MQIPKQPAGALAPLSSIAVSEGDARADGSLHFLAGQNRLLELVARGHHADEILAELCTLIEAVEQRAVVSVLVLDRERRCFGRVVTPSLDAAYSEALVGAPVDPPHLGTCGAAVFYGQPVLSLDIATDSRWHPTWRDLCLSYGLRACQSTPILASDGTPLGSFLISFRETSSAEAWNAKLIEVGTHLAGIVLEREAKDRRLQQAVREKTEALSMLQAMLDHAPIGFAFFDREHRYVRVNNFLEANYASVAPGRSLHEVSPSAGAMLAPQIDRVFRTAEVVSGLEAICELSRVAGKRGHWLVSLFPVSRQEGVAWVGAVMLDISERKWDEENRKLLLAELSHRVKNTLAVVQSIAAQTSREQVTTEDFVRALNGRIRALAHTHTLLSEADWRGARLMEIVRAELAPHLYQESPRITIEGPDLELTPRAAQTFALAIHELATNAAKYGALSLGSGRLKVRWTVEGQGEAARIRLVWFEAGLPAVALPTRHGFGRRLLERTFRHELEGEALLDFRTEGLVARLDAPLHSAVVSM